MEVAWGVQLAGAPGTPSARAMHWFARGGDTLPEVMFTETTAGAGPVARLRRPGITGWFRSVVRPPVPSPSPMPVSRRAGTGEVVAVLFDADNIAPAKAGAVLASAAQLVSCDSDSSLTSVP